MEPYKLRRWKVPLTTEGPSLFTCARPGRSKGPNGPVKDDLVHRWVDNLPGGTNPALVSLLGSKHGVSEFSFYSFCSQFDTPEERGRKPSFQEWLNRYHKDRGIRVFEHPTRDFVPIPEDRLLSIKLEILRLLSEGRTVVVVDSGGETRTRMVCKYMGLIEDCSRL